MAKARAVSTGLGLVSEGRERTFDELPTWDEAKVKTYPLVRPSSLLFNPIPPLLALIPIACAML
jgi:hypothetical protein